MKTGAQRENLARRIADMVMLRGGKSRASRGAQAESDDLAQCLIGGGANVTGVTGVVRSQGARRLIKSPRIERARGTRKRKNSKTGGRTFRGESKNVGAVV